MNHFPTTDAFSQTRSSAYPPMQQSLQFNDAYPRVQQLDVSPYASAPYSAIPSQPAKEEYRGAVLLLAILVSLLLLAGTGTYILIKAANTTKAVRHIRTPSGKVITASASAILANVQMSSDIDSNLMPTHITTTFIANQKMYITFTIHSARQDGSIEAKWYANGQPVSSTRLRHSHANTRGVFSSTYITAVPNGAVELYWCTQPDCSDAQLAQVVRFTVNAASVAPTGPSISLALY
ncbi:MAG: hypothetical protein NVS4B12_00230 [Ktedonobacteraceae bacterium]